MDIPTIIFLIQGVWHASHYLNQTSTGQRQGRRYNSTHERNERILARRPMAPGKIKI